MTVWIGKVIKVVGGDVPVEIRLACLGRARKRSSEGGGAVGGVGRKSCRPGICGGNIGTDLAWTLLIRGRTPNAEGATITGSMIRHGTGGTTKELTALQINIVHEAGILGKG